MVRSDQNSFASELPKEGKEPVEEIDGGKQVNRVPSVPVQRQGVDFHCQRVWDWRNKALELRVVAGGKQIDLWHGNPVISCQMEKPLEGVTVQGPLSWDRREEISLVC